jgi:hypothetical protein
LGKPLISDAAMRSMFDTMKHLRALKSEPGVLHSLSRADRAEFVAQPEALHAALLLQMHRRDTLITQGTDTMATAALTAYFPDGVTPSAVHTCSGTGDECAAVAAGFALKQTKATGNQGNRPVVIALLRSYPALTGVLQMIQDHDLSLLIVTQSEPETKAETQRRLTGTKVQILSVDDSDAVAVCRVVQESMLRARNGWGGAVIHAARIAGAPDAIDGMEQRLQRRGLLPASA